MNNSNIDSIPQSEWDSIIYTIIKPFLALCNSKTLVSVEDLQQEAWIALLKACDKYDPSYGTKFTTFAYICIRRHVIQYVNKTVRDEPLELDDHDVIDHSDNDIVEQRDLSNTIFGLVRDEEYSHLLYEHFVEDKSLRKLAKEHNVSHVSISNRIQKLLNILEKRLENANA